MRENTGETVPQHPVRERAVNPEGKGVYRSTSVRAMALGGGSKADQPER